MLGNQSVPVFLVVGVAATLAIGSTFTPVISRGGATTLTSQEVASRTLEYTYCETKLAGVDCVCFAGIAGHIMSKEVPKFRGSYAVDRSELARSQASQSC